MSPLRKRGTVLLVAAPHPPPTRPPILISPATAPRSVETSSQSNEFRSPARCARRYRPRLTAASYRFFVRGQSARAAAGDYVVAARKRAALAQYDRLLRKFRWVRPPFITFLCA